MKRCLLGKVTVTRGEAPSASLRAGPRHTVQIGFSHFPAEFGHLLLDSSQTVNLVLFSGVY